MESRMNDIYSVRNNVLTECDKMFAYVDIIKNKTDDLVNYMKQLNTQNFLKQYTAVYKHLHELHEKLVEQNCDFELFFLGGLKQFSVPNDEHKSNDHLTAGSSNINITQLNDNVLEPNVKIDKVVPPVLKETNSEVVVIKNVPAAENIPDNNTTREVEKVDKLKIQRSSKYLKYSSEQDTDNKSTKSEDNKQNDDSNIETLMKKFNKRTLEREQQKSSSRVPDLRPIYIKDDYCESTSSASEHSQPIVCHSRKNQKKKPLTHVRQNVVTDNIKTLTKTKESIENNIVIKSSPVPKEGALCYVSHIESPSNFYIQIVSEDNSLIDFLSNQIEEVLSYLKAYPTKLDAKKKIQDYCVCYIAKTNCWYRAKILNWLMENDDLISVQLIDYGNTCYVALRNVREAIPYFFEANVMATKCKLAWVKPPNNAKEWPNKSIDYFRNLLCSNEDSLYFLSYVQQDREQICVDLQNSEIISLAGDLISNKIAVDSHVSVDEEEDSDIWCNDYMKDQVIHSQGFSKKELKMSEEEKLQHDLEYDDDEEHTDPTLAVAHYAPRDETQICRIFLKNGYCFKGDNCRFSHTPLNPDGWTTDREAVYYEAFNKLVLPENGDITVKVISIVDLRTYYIVLKNLPQVMVSLTQPLYDIKSLVRFMNDPSEVTKYKQLRVKPAYGELILVKYNEKWQRGKILECYEYGNRVELDVFLVDFGEVLERVNMKTVRAIKERHLHLPFQAIMCCLANARMKDNITEEENDLGADYLEINILYKKLKATVVYSASYLNLHLFNEEGVDIGEELIKAGIVERSQLITLNPNSHILID